MAEKELGTALSSPDATAEEGGNAAVMYTYDKRRYVIDVLLPTYVSCVGIPVALVLFVAGVLRPLMLLLVVVCGYSVLNAFGAHSYPRTIAFDGESLRLESFGHVDEYPAGSITRLRLNPTPEGLRLYARVNDSSPLRGRYFLVCGDMYDEHGNKAKPVYDYLLSLASSPAAAGRAAVR